MVVRQKEEQSVSVLATSVMHGIVTSRFQRLESLRQAMLLPLFWWFISLLYYTATNMSCSFHVLRSRLQNGKEKYSHSPQGP